MAMFSNPSVHDEVFEQYMIDDDIDLDEADEKPVVGMETMSNNSHSDSVNFFIAFLFILELLVLAFVVVLEYFLRFTNVFPVQQVTFNCNDASIGQSSSGQSMTDFAYRADIPYVVVISLCFALPPLILMIGEVALWAFTNEHQKSVRAMCHSCLIPQVIRRIIRFIGVFLFGLVMTMIFTDVLKIFIGRLRPTFLEICKPNMTLCTSDFVDDSVCTETDKWKIRNARLSFPSIHASMTAFAAVFLAVYLHNVIKTHTVRLLKPFLGFCFVMCALMCGSARIALNHSFWTDVIAGYLIGIIEALYLGIVVLNRFQEHLSSEKLYLQLKDLVNDHRLQPKPRDLYKEDRLSYFGAPSWYSLNGSMTGFGMIPRANMRNGPSTSGHDQDKRFKAQNTFQRDLQRTLDQYKEYRRSSDSYL